MHVIDVPYQSLKTLGPTWGLSIFSARKYTFIHVYAYLFVVVTKWGNVYR